MNLIPDHLNSLPVKDKSHAWHMLRINIARDEARFWFEEEERKYKSPWFNFLIP